MSDQNPLYLRRRNPLTQERHRREVFWQITFPVLLAALVVLTVAVLAGFTSLDRASLWADISAIWLIIPLTLGSLLLMVVLAGLAYAVIKLVHSLPFYACQAQETFRRLSYRVSALCDQAAEPVLRIHSTRASAGKLGRSIRRR